MTFSLLMLLRGQLRRVLFFVTKTAEMVIISTARSTDSGMNGISAFKSLANGEIEKDLIQTFNGIATEV